jgi:hypothetical protein
MKLIRMSYRRLFLTTLSLLSVAHISLADENNLLTGTWSSECASNDAGSFIIETFKFANESATYSIKTYSDSACKKHISTLDTYREYTLGEAVKGMPDTRKLDYTFKSVAMTYTDLSSVAAANQLPGYYGFTDWKLNQSKDVSGLKRINSSSPEHSKGERFYTLVKKDKNKLYMGDYSSGAGTSDETRLSAIYNVPFIKT